MFHKIPVLFLAAFFLTFPAGSLRGTEPAYIQLKEIAEVYPGDVLLKDISSTQNMENEWMDKIKNTTVAEEPAFGIVKTLSRNQIDTIIRKTHPSFKGIRYSGATIVRIRLKGRSASREEIVPVLENYLIETTPWADHEIEIGSIKDLDKIELPPGEITLGISSKSPVVGNGKMLVPVDATRNGKTLSSFWVTADVHIKARILTAAKKIPYNKTITGDDVVEAFTEINNPRDDFYQNMENILGKISKRTFSPGDPLTREAFSKPFLVNSGEKVHLRLQRNGIELTTMVRAEQNGRLGQVIRVRNLEQSRTIEAIVTGRSMVTVH